MFALVVACYIGCALAIHAIWNHKPSSFTE